MRLVDLRILRSVVETKDFQGFNLRHRADTEVLVRSKALVMTQVLVMTIPS